MPQLRKIPGQSQDFGFLLGRGNMGLLTLKLRSLLSEFL